MSSADERAAAAAITPAVEDLSGIPSHFHAICREHGRALFEQVYCAGVAQHAINILANGLRRDRELSNAVFMAAEMFNKISALNCSARGFSAADIDRVNSAIGRTMDTKIIVPRSVGGLDS